jgi:hypothetical protein
MNNELFIDKKEDVLTALVLTESDLECQDMITWFFVEKWANESSATRQQLLITFQTKMMECTMDEHLLSGTIGNLIEARKYKNTFKLIRGAMDELKTFVYLKSQEQIEIKNEYNRE